MRIGLDLDGVVANWDATARMWLNQHKGYRFPVAEPSPSWHYIESKVKPDDWRWLWTDAIKRGMFAELFTFPGAQSFVRALTQLGDVVVLTARPPDTFEDTLSWWKENKFPRVTSWNFFSTGAEKVNVVVDYFIEDNLEYAVNYYKCGPRNNAAVILLDRPYNQGDRPKKKDFLVASTYDEILNYIKPIA